MIISAINNHARFDPSLPAISDLVETLSYKALAERVSVLAHWLTNEAITTFGFQLDNGIDWIVCDLAAIQAGITIVPIPIFFTESQLRHVIENANIDFFIQGAQTAPPSGWQMTTPPGLVSPEGFSPAERNRRGVKQPAIARKITYTSGSTGEPKGVCLEQATINAVTNSIVDAMSTIDVRKHLCILPLATLLENIAGLYAPLVKGIEVVVPDSSSMGLTGSSSLNVDRFAKTLELVAPHSIIAVPQLLMAVATLTELEVISPTYLKMIAVGGARVSTHLHDQASSLGLPVYEGYGLSECCSVLTLNTPLHHKKGSAGRPLPHARIRVNSRGELEARGAVMSGYLGESLQEHEWFPTGDIGYIDEEGFIFIQGRLKNIFITNYGRNVNPEWVEAELVQQPAISQALLYGDACDHNLALLWTRFDSDRETIGELVRQSNENLPDYARAHEFIIVDDELDASLTTDNGRIKRADVIQKYQSIIQTHYDRYSSGEDDAVLQSTHI